MKYPIFRHLSKNSSNEGTVRKNKGVRNVGFRHCDWSCRMTQSIGIDQAKTVGDLHELYGTANGQPNGERTMDLLNNNAGRQLGQTGGSCTSMCATQYFKGKLFDTNGQTW
jgi:hypothetical protein